MPYSCADFTSNLVNHLFANGLITVDVVDSDDLEQQATASMEAISNLALRTANQVAPAAASVADQMQLIQPLSVQFMGELLERHEILTGIGSEYGMETLADCMYLLAAIQKQTSISVEQPTESKIVDVLQTLPSTALWMTYVHQVLEVTE